MQVIRPNVVYATITTEDASSLAIISNISMSIRFTQQPMLADIAGILTPMNLCPKRILPSMSISKEIGDTLIEKKRVN